MLQHTALPILARQESRLISAELLLPGVPRPRSAYAARANPLAFSAFASADARPPAEKSTSTTFSFAVMFFGLTLPTSCPLNFPSPVESCQPHKKYICHNASWYQRPCDQIKAKCTFGGAGRYRTGVQNSYLLNFIQL